MTVMIEPLAIGNLDGPIVYILVRRVGGHLDIEEMPDSVEDDQQAIEFAAWRWGVAECDVQFKMMQVIPIEKDE